LANNDSRQSTPAAKAQQWADPAVRADRTTFHALLLLALALFLFGPQLFSWIFGKPCGRPARWRACSHRCACSGHALA
jgi:hypothetical protein